MADMLRADIAALRIMAAGMRHEADAVASIDPVDLIARVARAMPNSALGAAAATLGDPLRSSVTRMGDCLRTLADGAERAHTTYADAERDLKNQIDSYLHPAS
ncbi:hypothetical protein D7D52_35540 [Nocardia yunnanensis]|uniref:ESX-1 secretion-associated protein n=1 Tax=Nocardia yunnanensis TaxID=2382165 RepID=A0A386ZLD2_9NOCA|nr:hypothetical protein [Nocardia yunnanensis]AYF78266.1 hypothetical protein D7D52_35540 [Nocardia yunnanensis]